MALAKFISFRLSLKEHQAVKAAARENKMPVGVWVRTLALDAAAQKMHIEETRTITAGKRRKAA